METTTELPVVYGMETLPQKGKSFKLKILLDAGRELTKEEKWGIREYADKIHKMIKERDIALDPESKLRAITDKENILKLFNGNDIFIEEIPNGYCSDYCCKHLPWFIVTTKKGRIKIGWRKRVIEIDWMDSIIKQGATALFPNEEVTKGDKYIHAWGYEKAAEYIKIILNS